MAPKGTPQEIVDRLNAEIAKIIAKASVREAWSKQGAVPMTMTPAQFDAFLRRDIDKWAEIIKKADIKLQ
jgi:tripartite-type tricarboxylate transporter receptor subunit TctC